VTDFSQHELQGLLHDVINAAQAGGKIILAYFQGGFSQQVTIKSDQTPVTLADVAANQAITAALKKIDSRIPILSEENDIPDFSVRQQWSRYWLVDPLDGTRGFINRSAQFCVNIALIENQVPTLGVIYAPVEKQVCYAVRHAPAFFLQENQRESFQIKADKKMPNQMRLLTGHYDPRLTLKDALRSYFGNVSIVKMNSALKFSMIARGMADLYVRFGSTSEWDTAAGQCILESAGGLVVDFQGNPLQYNAKSSLINPAFIAMGDVAQLQQYVAFVQQLEIKK